MLVTNDGNTFTPDNPSLAAGGTLDFENQSPAAPHNLVARDAGPDGGPLFDTPSFKGPGVTKPVQGVQYLSPGPYDFHCTIHPEMTGTLTVTAGTPVKRPKITVTIKDSKLAKVRKSGVLKTKVTNSTTDGQAELVATLGNKILGHKGRVEVAGGDSQGVSVKLSKGGRKALAGLKKAKVKLAASVLFGKPAAAKKTLK